MPKKKIVVAIPHSHTWFWTTTCLSSLMRNPPRAGGYEVEIVVIDNSPWSPAIYGVTDTAIGSWLNAGRGCVMQNYKSNKFHASALDCVVETCDFDLLMALETDVMALRPEWLQWFVDQMRDTDFAVGMWHHEQFVNPSCTLYRGTTLRAMLGWCRRHPDPDVLRWGDHFTKTAPLDNNLPMSENPAEVLRDMKGWIGGPFAEKRGWPESMVLKEVPSGQLKGPGWYEPGQQLHHWAVQGGATYTVCPNATTKVADLPVQSIYGGWGQAEYRELSELASYRDQMRLGEGERLHDHGRQLEAVELFGNGQTVHLWGGTRALDILKHPVTCQFVKSKTPYWLAREARFWRHVVPVDVQVQVLDLIRRHDWHITGQGSDHVSDRDREAAEYVKECYEAGGVTW